MDCMYVATSIETAGRKWKDLAPELEGLRSKPRRVFATNTRHALAASVNNAMLMLIGTSPRMGIFVATELCTLLL